MNENDYKKMLEHAFKELPDNMKTRERFEIPKVQSIIQGKKTIIKNFNTITKAVHREKEEISKFLAKELGTIASKQEENLILTGKFSEQEIQKAFETFVKEFVLCKECNRPDTKYEQIMGVKMLKCTACGASNPIRR